MKIVLITQARMGSTRLPGKVLKKVGNKTMLEVHLLRALRSKKVDEFILATTDQASDTSIADFGRSFGIKVYRGSEMDVLDRYYQAAKLANADIIVRITSDCPLIDPELIDELVQAHLDHKKDFTSNIITRTYPDGQDVEVFNFAALERAWKESAAQSDREHVTYYIWKNSDLEGGDFFSAFNIEHNKDLSAIRMTLDYPHDFTQLSHLITTAGIDKNWEEYVALYPSVKE